MDEFVINGGKPLRGEIRAQGVKNAAFSVLAATLLTKEECLISNLPLIEDVFRMLEIMKSMGVEVSWPTKRTVKVKARNLDPSKVKKELVVLFRGSVLLYGPLLARFGKIKLPQPGGCVIGARPISTHLSGFSQLGVDIKPKGDGFELSLAPGFQKTKDRGAILNEFSVTATENLMLFASLLPGKTVIKIADADYQVQELAGFLKKMGVEIKGAGTHTLVLKGAAKLAGAKHSLMYDPIEAGTFIIMAASNPQNRIVVKNVELPFLEFTLKKLKDFGVPWKIVKKFSRERANIEILPWKNLKIDKIQCLPFPGIPSDLLSAFGVLATQAPGPTLIHDPLYEARLKYLEGINKMGGEVIFADPHRAIVNGPTQLYGAELGAFDLRGGAALIIAALLAKGRSRISNIYQVDRGYERIEERLQKLGADIQRVKG